MRRMRGVHIPYRMMVYENTLAHPPNETIALDTGTRLVANHRASSRSFEAMLRPAIPLTTDDHLELPATEISSSMEIRPMSILNHLETSLHLLSRLKVSSERGPILELELGNCVGASRSRH